MNEATENHFYAWLETRVPWVDRRDVEHAIRKLVAELPWVLEGMSWPEILHLSDTLEARKAKP